ncbi:MAG: hypothetical protein QM796_00335 [Chthoniobacteraceae bacterium]
MSGATDAIGRIDFAGAIRAIDPAYFDEAHCGARFAARIQVVQHCRSDGRLYFVFAEAFVFYSEDHGASLHEVAEINRPRGVLAAAGSQFADAIVDTIDGTVLVVGRDAHDGAPRGVAWRKERDSARFERVVCADPAWQTSKNGNAAAGFFGQGATPMVALAIYASPAHLYFSLDDGRTFQRQPLEAEFLEHVHEVYLPRAKTLERRARLWVSGGDDPSGARSGVVTFETLDDRGQLATRRRAFGERPGYRLVDVGRRRQARVHRQRIACRRRDQGPRQRRGARPWRLRVRVRQGAPRLPPVPLPGGEPRRSRGDGLRQLRLHRRHVARRLGGLPVREQRRRRELPRDPPRRQVVREHGLRRRGAVDRCGHEQGRGARSLRQARAR